MVEALGFIGSVLAGLALFGTLFWGAILAEERRWNRRQERGDAYAEGDHAAEDREG